MKKKVLKRMLAAALSISVLAVVQSISFAAAERNDQSTSLFADDFENYTAEAVSSDLMTKWYMNDDLSECAIIEEGDNKVLKIRNTSGAPVLALKQGTISPKIENTPVKISFDIQVPSGTDEVWGLVCPVMEEDGDNTNYGQNQMIQIRRAQGAADTTIQIKHSDDSFKTINISNDAWYNVTIEENLGNAGHWSYIVTVCDESGAVIGKDYEANSPYMGSFQNINFTNWKNGAYHIDNVSIEKISRGLEISDDMEYDSKAEASKYWRINGDNYGFKQIDEAHGQTAYSGGAEFHTCVASEPIENNYALIEFDTYIAGNNNGNSNNCGRFNVIDKNGTGNPGGNTIVRFDQRANDENVDLYVGDNWINQLQKDWYHVTILLNLNDKNYTVSVVSSTGNNYCSGNQNAVENTTRAIDSLALINFNSWADNFYFDNVKLEVLNEPPSPPEKAELTTQSSIITKKISDKNKAMGIITTITNEGSADGTFNKIKWTITSGGETRTVIETQNKDAILIPQGSSVRVGCIINGLCDENAEIIAEIE